MTGSQEEKILYAYFCAEVLAGLKGDMADKMLDKLCSLHRFGNSSALHTLLSSDCIVGTRSVEDYERYVRIEKFLSMENRRPFLSEDERCALILKGKALALPAELRISRPTENTEESFSEQLSKATNKGCVVAMRTYGLMLTEGISVEKNTELGLRYLKRAADWNDKISLAALRDEGVLAEDEWRALTLAAENAESALSDLENLQRKGIMPHRKAGAALISLAFSSGVLDEKFYDGDAAAIAYAGNIALPDKKRLILKSGKDERAVAARVPLDILPFDGRVAEIFDCAAAVPPRAVCVHADCKYLLKRYAKKVTEAATQSGINVTLVDTADLMSGDLEPVYNNVFLRGLRAGRANILMIIQSGTLSPAEESAVVRFLKIGSRASYRLLRPELELDLSEALPVCLCSNSASAAYLPYCSDVALGPITDNTFESTIDDMAEELRQKFGLQSVNLDNAARELFLQYGADRFERALDAVFSCCAAKNLNVTADMLERAEKRSYVRTGVCGFGGVQS